MTSRLRVKSNKLGKQTIKPYSSQEFADMIVNIFYIEIKFKYSLFIWKPRQRHIMSC